MNLLELLTGALEAMPDKTLAATVRELADADLAAIVRRSEDARAAVLRALVARDLGGASPPAPKKHAAAAPPRKRKGKGKAKSNGSPKPTGDAKSALWGGKTPPPAEEANAQSRASGAANRARLLEAIRGAGDEGIATAALLKDVELKPSGALYHLRALEADGQVQRTGNTSKTRWYAASA